MDCRSTRLAGGAIPRASEESRMPETAELTALPELHRALAQPPSRAGASPGGHGAMRAASRGIADHDGLGGFVRGSAR